MASRVFPLPDRRVYKCFFCNKSRLSVSTVNRPRGRLAGNSEFGSSDSTDTCVRIGRHTCRRDTPRGPASVSTDILTHHRRTGRQNLVSHEGRGSYCHRPYGFPPVSPPLAV